MRTGAERFDGDASVSRHRELLDEHVQRRGLHPVRSLDDVAREDVFESDEELDAFLAHVQAERQANRPGRVWWLLPPTATMPSWLSLGRRDAAVGAFFGGPTTRSCKRF
jgi:hypothetical protein